MKIKFAILTMLIASFVVSCYDSSGKAIVNISHINNAVISGTVGNNEVYGENQYPEGIEAIEVSVYNNGLQTPSNLIYQKIFSKNTKVAKVEVKPGPNLVIVVNVLNADGEVIYTGNSGVVELIAGALNEVTIFLTNTTKVLKTIMLNTSGTSYGLVPDNYRVTVIPSTSYIFADIDNIKLTCDDVVDSDVYINTSPVGGLVTDLELQQGSMNYLIAWRVSQGGLEPYAGDIIEIGKAIIRNTDTTVDMEMYNCVDEWNTPGVFEPHNNCLCSP
ncbi:hypothetical protein ACFL20_13900 [Spirochaetota bacterium]